MITQIPILTVFFDLLFEQIILALSSTTSKKLVNVRINLNQTYFWHFNLVKL